MQYYNIIISLLCATTLASPTTGNKKTSGGTTSGTETSGSTTKVKVPEFMTKDKCKTLCDAAKAKKPLFYGQCKKDAEEACAGNKPDLMVLTGHYTLSDIVSSNGKKGEDVFQEYRSDFKALQTSLGDWNQLSTKIASGAFWPSCSQAIAELAEGEVFVLFPKAENVLSNGVLNWETAGARPQSVWEVHEYPFICGNSKVTKLTHLASEDKDFKEDLTDKLESDRKAGCPKAGDIPTVKALSEKPRKAYEKALK